MVLQPRFQAAPGHQALTAHESIPSAPPGVLSEYAKWSKGIVWQWAPHTVTWRMESPTGEIRFLKLSRRGWTPSAADEAIRMQWAREYLPVPTVVEDGSDESVDWMITTGLGGLDATHPTFRSDPEKLVRILAGGLRRFHEAPVEACPFDFRVDAALRVARTRLERGEIDAERDFHPEHAHLKPVGAVEELERTRPDEEDLVVCHGDYCLPNALIEHDRVTGYVDLGELGVADRWWDLAVASWSVTWNLGPGLEELFLQSYGVEADGERIRFYRLLYDVVS